MLSNGTGSRGNGTFGQEWHLKIETRTDRERVVKRETQGPRIEERMKTKDKSRKWMWGFLGMVLAMQMYFVRELLAAFALFALGFAAVASVVAALYMLHHGGAVAVERVAQKQDPERTSP